jgi:hypothetical protein
MTEQAPSRSARTRKKLGNISLDGWVRSTRHGTCGAHEPSVAPCACNCWIPLATVELLTHEIGEKL